MWDGLLFLLLQGNKQNDIAKTSNELYKLYHNYSLRIWNNTSNLEQQLGNFAGNI